MVKKLPESKYTFVCRMTVLMQNLLFLKSGLICSFKSRQKMAVFLPSASRAFALITWLSCTDHETAHALITSISCTDHMTAHALITWMIIH